MVDAGEGRRELVTALAAVNAGADAELVVAAQRLLELTDPVGATAGKYQVVVREAPINLEAGWRTLALGADWTKHAEGKAVAALASCGVLGSLLYMLVKGAQPRSTAVVLSALISLALVLAAGACSSLALRPRSRTPGEQNSPLFYDHVARRHDDGPQSYRPVLAALSRDPEALLGAIADQIWAISRTTQAKYRWAGRALILLLLALLSLATTAVLTIAAT